MPTDKEKEVIQWDSWLLEAVRKIRTQKQRPGLDRIYNAVRLLAEKQEQAEHSQKSPIAPIYHVQFNQVKIEQVQRHLDRAVRKGLLLKVYSKGQATFKSVEKSERTLNLAPVPPGTVTVSGENGGGASGELSKCILKVIRELSECDAPVPTSSSVTVSALNNSTKVAKLGYTFETIEEYVRHSHVIIYPDEREDEFLPNLVRQALAKEVSRGKLELVGGEHYRLPSSSTASQGAPTSSSSSQGKKDKSLNPSSTSVSSSNSNSSWSSSSSSKSLTKTNTFAGMSSVNKPVKSAPTPPPSQGTPTLTAVTTTAPLIKKDAGKPVKSSDQISSHTPPSNSPPRPNLNPDLSEAEEIALVTEQTARAVMLVMKDRKPGEKPPPSSSSSSGGSSPKQKKSTPSPEPIIVEPIEIIPKQASPAHSSASEDEKKGKEAESSSSSRRSSITGDSAAPTHKNGNGGNGNGTAVIKLMVPAFPGRNGGNGNGNSKGVVNKPAAAAATPTPPQPSNATPVVPPVSQGSKGVTATAPEKNPKTSGAVESNISSAPAASVAPATTITSASTTATSTTASKGTAKSISNIASVIMNKKTNEVESGGGARKSRSKNKKNLASSASPSPSTNTEDVQESSKDNISTNIIEGAASSSSSLEEGEYVVEKLVDKQEDVNGHVFYLVKWQGYADENNTWESEEKFDEMQDLVQEYEDGVVAAAILERSEAIGVVVKEEVQLVEVEMPEEPEPDEGFDDEVPATAGSIEVPTPGTVESIDMGLPEGPVGFARGFQPKKILGALDHGGELCFMMEWKGSTMKDIVPAREANVKCPQIVIKWYETQINWSRKRTLDQLLQSSPANNNQQ